VNIAMHNWMRAEPIETTLGRLAKAGYDGLEISGEPEKYDTGEVRRQLQESGIECVGAVTLMVEGRDLVAKDEAKRSQSADYVKACITMVKELSGGWVTIVPSTVGKVKPEADADEEWAWAIDSLKDCYEHGAREGVQIVLEPINRFETYFLNRHDQALMLADAVGPDCGVCLDAFHISIEEADPFQAILNVGNKMVDFHIADNNRMPPGHGNYDWKRVVNTLRKGGYEGPLTVEFVAPIDYTPANPYKNALEQGDAEIGEDELKFIEDHGGGAISDEFYGWLVDESIKELRRAL
jgi:D-psicose/D-tagatose/L-ribulose 3-epimerase